MENKFAQRTNKNLSKVVGYLLIFYTFFMLGRSIWLNYQLNKQTEIVEGEIKEAQIKNKNFENLILYYKSDSFREVEARRKLGLKKSGETAVAIAVKKYDNFQTELESQQEKVSQKETASNTPNWRLWWQLFAK